VVLIDELMLLAFATRSRISSARLIARSPC